MTNEDKAREILDRANFNKDEYLSEFEDLLEMAEWKDKQFKDAINSTLDYFDRGREAGFVSENSYNDMRYFASKVINELFGE